MRLDGGGVEGGRVEGMEGRGEGVAEGVVEGVEGVAVEE